MKPWAPMRSNSASSGFQKPSMFSKHDRLGVAAELRPGELLDELLERAEAAGQRHEGIGLGEHQLLALMHVVDHDQLLGLDQHMLPLAQEAGNDAGDMAAMMDHRTGDLAHQAEAAAAIDEPDARLRQDAAEGVGGLEKCRVLARPGAAIDTDALQAGNGLTVIHELHLPPGLRGVNKGRPASLRWREIAQFDRFPANSARV